MNNNKGLGKLRSVYGGRWRVALLISLSGEAKGNDKNVFERDGIYKDKNNKHPFLFRVSLLILCGLYFFYFFVKPIFQPF